MPGVRGTPAALHVADSRGRVIRGYYCLLCWWDVYIPVMFITSFFYSSPRESALALVEVMPNIRVRCTCTTVPLCGSWDVVVVTGEAQPVPCRSWRWRGFRGRAGARKDSSGDAVQHGQGDYLRRAQEALPEKGKNQSSCVCTCSVLPRPLGASRTQSVPTQKMANSI